MAKVVYVGPSLAVDIIVPGGAIRAEKNKPVDVPDDLAKSLLAQDTFETKATTKQEQD